VAAAIGVASGAESEGVGGAQDEPLALSSLAMPQVQAAASVAGAGADLAAGPLAARLAVSPVAAAQVLSGPSRAAQRNRLRLLTAQPGCTSPTPSVAPADCSAVAVATAFVSAGLGGGGEEAPRASALVAAPQAERPSHWVAPPRTWGGGVICLDD